MRSNCDVEPIPLGLEPAQLDAQLPDLRLKRREVHSLLGNAGGGGAAVAVRSMSERSSGTLGTGRGL